MRKPLIALGFALLAAVLVLAGAPTAHAQATTTLEDLVSAVVRVKAFINPDGRTIATLGREREGTGVVISADGLVITIGYLMLEAHAVEIATSDGHTVSANVVGYDHETGFGLLKAATPLKVRPMGLGKSADIKEKDPVLVASFGGPDMVSAAHVAARREFAGSWEYLLEGAIFTSPPHPAWSGAALISREGKLVGVGSLIVGDATGTGDGVPGNMFVPIDLVKPILADLIEKGRVSGPPRPWLGMATEEVQGRLFVTRVSPQAPADRAGVRRGDIVIGVGADPVTTHAEFYRKLWSLGPAGTEVPLKLLQGASVNEIKARSIDRMEYFRVKPTL